MFIIVESGSSKADWAVVNETGESTIFQTAGINPSTQKNFNHINFDPKLMNFILSASNIYFYGAGVIGESSMKQIKQGFKKLNAPSNIFAAGDMLAAARACCGHHPGVVAILGTGSNSCVYDGNEISSAIPSLGYILSDEGGGVHLGKEILKSYFYGLMPKFQKELFELNYPITKEELVNNLYKSSGGSQYIASFAPFISMTEGEWRDQLVKSVFSEFVQLRITPYKNISDYPIHFVGSIAYKFQDILKQVLEKFGYRLGKIIQQPIQSLITYHYNKINKNE